MRRLHLEFRAVAPLLEANASLAVRFPPSTECKSGAKTTVRLEGLLPSERHPRGFTSLLSPEDDASVAAGPGHAA